MSTGQGSAEIGIGIGTTLNCNHEAPILANPLCFDARQDPCDYGHQSGSLNGQSPHSMAIAIQERAICENPAAGPNRLDEEQNGSEELMGCLKARKEGGGFEAAVAFQEAQTGVREYAESGTLRANGPGHDPVGTRLRIGMQVRRLTPIETARLQGVPDNHCRIPYKGRMMADGPIYKMHGNGFCVNVVRWIGERVQRTYLEIESER